jgi:hypothetical protein
MVRVEIRVQGADKIDDRDDGRKNVPLCLERQSTKSQNAQQGQGSRALKYPLGPMMGKSQIAERAFATPAQVLSESCVR